MRKSFTLLELITVVIIVAILVSIAVPQFFRVAERARSAEGIAALGAIRSAQMRYYAEHSIFTGNLTDLDVDVGINMKFFDNTTLTAADDTGWDNATYVGSVQRDDSVAYSDRNNPYTLKINKEGTIWCEYGGNKNMCSKIGLPTSP